jgi:hypothetical protein
MLNKKNILYIFGEKEKKKKKIYNIRSLAKSSGLKPQVVANSDGDWF